MPDLPYLATHGLAPVLSAWPVLTSDLLDQRGWCGPVAHCLQPNVAIFHPDFQLFAFPQVGLFEDGLRDPDRLTVSPLHELRLGACHKRYPRFQVYTLVYPRQVSNTPSVSSAHAADP